MSRLIIIALLVLSPLVAQAKLYLVETENILVYVEDDKYTFIGHVSNLSYDQTSLQNVVNMRFKDQPRSMKNLFVHPSDQLTIQLLAGSIGQTKVAVKSYKTVDGEYEVKSVQLIAK
jgi:hypothetical protein